MGVLSKNVTVKQAGALTFLRLSTQLGYPHWAALKRSWALFAVNPYWGAVGSCCSLFDFYPWGYCCLFGNLLYLLLTSSISTRWSKTLLDNYYYWLNSLKVKSLSHIRLFVTTWTITYQAPLSMGFSSPGYWSGLPFPSPGDLPDPGVEPRSPTLQANALPLETPGRLNSLGNWNGLGCHVVISSGFLFLTLHY